MLKRAVSGSDPTNPSNDYHRLLDVAIRPNAGTSPGLVLAEDGVPVRACPRIEGLLRLGLVRGLAEPGDDGSLRGAVQRGRDCVRNKVPVL